jgi:serine/threonine protein phosphatase 1
MSPVYYAIGDVHGRSDLLETLHGRIAAYHRMRHQGRPATLVHLGDYIDGGPDSRGVIDRLMAGAAGFEVLCLKGNHEAMLLDCLETDDQQVWGAWRSNGGDATLASFGVSFRFGGYDRRELALALGEARVRWLRALPLHHRVGGLLFVHAGIAPGKPLAEQTENDLLWIRRRFLDSDADHGFRVIHGHTPTATDEPELRPNRINVDTGAGSSGPLTAVALRECEGKAEINFLSAERGRG